MSQPILHVFERHLIAQGKRPGTVDCYVAVVGRFLAATDLPVESVTTDHAYAWLIDLGNRLGRSGSWFNVCFHAVLRWLESRRLSTDLRGLQPQRRLVQPPRWFTADEVARLLAAVDHRTHRLVFQVMVSTGLRISEALAIRVGDLDRERPLLRVPCGKGGDGRIVLVGATLLDWLRLYWRSFRPRGLLFTRRPGIDDEPLCTATLNRSLKVAAQRAGIAGPISSHRLRHTFAVHSLRAGQDIVTLQRLLGHRRLQSTLRYVTPDLQRPGIVVDLLRDLGVAP